MVTMMVAPKSASPDFKGVIITNPTHIPRIGDNIDLHIYPAPKVINVLWQFNNNDTIIYIVVD